MKCIVHIGTEKTGTTSIQNFIYDNRTKLREHGVHITDSFGVSNNRYIPAYFCQGHDDFNLMHGLKSKSDKEVFFSNFDLDFKTEIERAGMCKIFLISSEHFHSRLRTRDEISNLRCFLSQYFNEVKIICYFREQSDMLFSQYSTGVKGKETRDFDGFIADISPNTYHFNFLDIADNWSGVFGNENCVFRLFHKSFLRQSDIRYDFLDAIELGDSCDGFIFKSEEANLSLSPMQIAAFRAINKAIPYWCSTGGVNLRNKEAKNAILRVAALQYGVMSSPHQKDIYEKFSDSNALFFQKYFPFESNFPFKERRTRAEYELSEEDLEKLVYGMTLELSQEIGRFRESRSMGGGRITRLSYFIECLDCQIHVWLSRSRFVPRSVNLRFKGPAERRKRKIMWIKER